MTIPRPLLGAVIVAQLATVAVAGEINEKSGVAISGYDPVAYFVQSKPVEGKADLAVTYRDARFLFASEENRKAFEANPGKYAPQYGGFCAYGMSRGYKAPIDPAAFTIVDDKLYLNYDQSVLETWRKDIKGYVTKADQNWPAVKLQ